MQETGAETLLATAVETAAAESEEVTDMDTEPKRRKKSSLGLNCDRVMCCLLPATGSISYQIFAVHVYFPHLLKRTLSTHHLIFENCLLYNSHIGVGLYLYTRKHMKLVPIYYRVMYSVYGSVIFNFGSILLWALTKRLLPHSKIVRTTVALTSALSLLAIGKEYLQFVDNSI